jgi:hypothetical protein
MQWHPLHSPLQQERQAQQSQAEEQGGHPLPSLRLPLQQERQALQQERQAQQKQAHERES